MKSKKRNAPPPSNFADLFTQNRERDYVTSTELLYALLMRGPRPTTNPKGKDDDIEDDGGIFIPEGDWKIDKFVVSPSVIGLLARIAGEDRIEVANAIRQPDNVLARMLVKLLAHGTTGQRKVGRPRETSLLVIIAVLSDHLLAAGASRSEAIARLRVVLKRIGVAKTKPQLERALDRARALLNAG